MLFPETERLIFMKKTQQKTLERFAVVAMLSAVAFVLFLLEFPVIPSLSHLKLDFSDVPALVAGVLYGPAYGVVVELVKNVIELLVKGMGTQMGFGNLMNFIVGCAYVVPFSIIYRKNLGNLLGCIAGTAVILVAGFGANYFIAPLFFKHFLGVNLDHAGLMAAVWGATAINAIKGVMLSIISLPLVRVLLERLKKFTC